MTLFEKCVNQMNRNRYNDHCFKTGKLQYPDKINRELHMIGIREN